MATDPNDPLIGYSRDWRKTQRAGTATADPLAGYSPDWRDAPKSAAPNLYAHASHDDGPEKGGDPASDGVKGPNAQLVRKLADASREDQGDAEGELGPIEGTVRGLARGIGQIAEGFGGALRAMPGVADLAPGRAPEMSFLRRATGARGPQHGSYIADLGGRAADAVTPAEPLAFLDRAAGTVEEVNRAAGEKIAAAGRAVQEDPRLAPSTSVQEGGVLQPGNWRWWTERSAEFVPQLVSQIGLAYATRGGSVPTQFAAFALPTAIQEGGSQYNDTFEALKSQGATDEEAHSSAQGSALVTGVVNAAIEKLSFDAMVLKRLPGLVDFARTSALRRLAAGAAAGFGAEGLEEVAQEVVGDLAQYAATRDPETFADLPQRALASGLLGGLAGAGTNVVTGNDPIREAHEQRPERLAPQESVPPILSPPAPAVVEPASAPEAAAPVLEPTPSLVGVPTPEPVASQDPELLARIINEEQTVEAATQNASGQDSAPATQVEQEPEPVAPINVAPPTDSEPAAASPAPEAAQPAPPDARPTRVAPKKAPTVGEERDISVIEGERRTAVSAARQALLRARQDAKPADEIAELERKQRRAMSRLHQYLVENNLEAHSLDEYAQAYRQEQRERGLAQAAATESAPETATPPAEPNVTPPAAPQTRAESRPTPRGPVEGVEGSEHGGVATDVEVPMRVHGRIPIVSDQPTQEGTMIRKHPWQMRREEFLAPPRDGATIRMGLRTKQGWERVSYVPNSPGAIEYNRKQGLEEIPPEAREERTVIRATRALPDPTRITLPAGDHLYHYTQVERMPRIRKQGLRPVGSGVDAHGRGSQTGGNAGGFVYALEESSGDIFENGVARDATNADPDGWAILRFRRAGEWHPDPEFQDGTRSVLSQQSVSPREIEVLTAEGWMPIQAVGTRRVREHRDIVERALLRDEEVPREVIAEYPDLASRIASRHRQDSSDDKGSAPAEGRGAPGVQERTPAFGRDTDQLASLRSQAEDRAQRDGSDARMYRVMRGSVPRGRGRMGTPKVRADQASSPQRPPSAPRPADPLRSDAQRPPGPAAAQSAAPPKPKKGGPVSAPQVMWALGRIAKAAGKEVPMRVGRLGTKNAAGLFKVREEVIRILEANDLPVAAHEVAHAVEKLLFGWPKGGPWVNPRVDAAIQRELTQMGRDLYGDQTPTGGYKREGWAEYVRMWLTTDGEAQTKAPNLTRWFDGAFREEFPEVRARMDEARALAERWRAQGARERAAQSMVDAASPKERAKKAAEDVRALVSKEAWIDMAEPFRKISDAAKERGHTMAPSEDPFVTISALRMTHSARARYMVENGMIDLAGNVVGPALDDIRALVRGRRKDFTIYLWARRAETLWLDPQGQRNPGLSLEDAQQIVQELGSPEFQLAADKVYVWSEGVLDYAAQASPTFADAVQKIRERDPGNYVPLLRVFEELDQARASLGRGASAARGSLTKRLKGSGRRIKDPFQSLVSKAEQTVRAAHERLVIEQLLQLSKVEGLGHLMEEVPVEQAPATVVSIDEVINRLNRELEDAGGTKLEGDDLDLAGRTLTFFAPQQRPGGKDAIVPIWDGGKVRWFQVDPELHRALGTLDVYRLPDTLGLLGRVFLDIPAQVFRAGTTGLRASFGLLWNPTRDLQTLYMNSRVGARPHTLLAAYLRSMGDAALFRTTGRKNPYMDLFVRLGGEMAQPLGQDIPHTRRAAHRIFQGWKVRVVDPRNWFDTFRDLVQTPEAAPRVAEGRLKATEVGWAPGETMTLDQSLQILLSMKQVTTDFTAAGEMARVLNRMAPFFNAAIQGPRATILAARDRPGRFALRGLQLTASTLLLWSMYRDEEWYKEMPYQERFLNWHFPFEWNGRKELLRLPRAFEVGAIFSALPELLVDAWYREDPEAAKAWVKTLVEASVPSPTPVLLGETFEQFANRDFFWDRPIVPRGEEDKPAAEQYNEYTSRAAIALGRTFGRSPRRVDHAIQGLFGPVGGDVLSVLGLGPKGVEREKELTDLPIVGRAFQRGGAMGTRLRSVETLYDALEKAQLRANSDARPETAEERQVRLQLEDAVKAVSALSFVRGYTGKTEQRAALTGKMAAIAQDAVKMTEGGEVDRGQFRRERRLAEREKERTKEAVAERRRRESPREVPGGKTPAYAEPITRR